MLKNTSTAYGSVTQFLHWLIALLVVCMLIVGFTMGGITDKVMRGQVVNAHKVTGVLVLVLMLIRAGWAIINVKPGLPFQTPAWQKMAERLVHLALYAALIIMPLSGLIGAVSAGRPPHIGDLEIRLPIPQDKNMAEFMFDSIHGPLAFIILFLLTIHIGAALYHHFIKRDDILRRMLFNRARR